MSSHIVSNPRICSGKPVIRGTRILVSIVLDQIRRGMTTAEIVDEWEGKVTTEAVAELSHIDL